MNGGNESTDKPGTSWFDPTVITNVPAHERLRKQAEAIARGAEHLQYRPYSLWHDTILPTLCALSAVALVVGGFYVVGCLQ